MLHLPAEESFPQKYTNASTFQPSCPDDHVVEFFVKNEKLISQVIVLGVQHPGLPSLQPLKSFKLKGFSSDLNTLKVNGTPVQMIDFLTLESVSPTLTFIVKELQKAIDICQLSFICING